MLITLTHPLLLLILLSLLPLRRPPPESAPDSEIANGYSQNNDNVPSVVRRVSCERETDASVDQTEKHDCRAKVFVDLRVLC